MFMIFLSGYSDCSDLTIEMIIDYKSTNQTWLWNLLSQQLLTRFLSVFLHNRNMILASSGDHWHLPQSSSPSIRRPKPRSNHDGNSNEHTNKNTRRHLGDPEKGPSSLVLQPSASPNPCSLHRLVPGRIQQTAEPIHRLADSIQTVRTPRPRTCI